jgi:flavin reductase (DIM6/NTAB) family NADH-FMN oxidoreductase RutF
MLKGNASLSSPEIQESQIPELVKSYSHLCAPRGANLGLHITQRNLMELSLFREHFAQVPRHVAVLGLHKGDQVYGVTVSSIQTVSVNEHRQFLTFVLKKNSSFSEILIEKRKFTINFLAVNQEEISKVYSYKNRSPLEVGNKEIWSRSDDGFVFLNGAVFSISATFEELIELEESNIFFVIAEEILESNNQEMLLYSKRSYGVFQEWKNP